MKKLVSILLLFGLSMQYFIQTGFISWFELNKSEIVEYFCINKGQSEIQCNGKCYLNKELNQLDPDHKNSTSRSTQVEHPVFLQPDPEQKLSFSFQLLNQLFPLAAELYVFLLPSALFRPPQLRFNSLLIK